MTGSYWPRAGAVVCAVAALVVSAAARGARGQSHTPPKRPAGQPETAHPLVNQPLSLDQAVTIALKNSPMIHGSAEDLRAAQAGLSAARSKALPWLSANTFVSGGSNSNIISTPGTTQPQMIMNLSRGFFLDQNLMLMLPVFSGGGIQSGIRQASELRDAAAADLDAQRQEVALMTRLDYRDAVARGALVDVAQARLKENQERLRIDQAKLQQGAVPILTVKRDEAEVADSQQDLTNALRDQELSMVQLKAVMGVDPASQIQLTDTNQYTASAQFLSGLEARAPAPSPPAGAPQTATALPADLAALLRLAKAQRPELIAARRRVRSADAAASVARSELAPQVNLFAMGDFMKTRTTNPFTGDTYGVVASLPLFNGGARHADIRGADARRRRAQDDLDQMDLQVSQEVTTALLDLRAAEQNVQTARAGVAAAEEGYRVMLERYQAGRSILTEVLDTLAERTLAQSNVVQSLYQYGASRDQLLRAVGAPTVLQGSLGGH